ncbi:S41 family peptidase [Actinomadura rubrisoli]|uniref:S41 family peptidase n=1 Tax=Actinomadura rubrisoli TaxID=2530368 RepID=UPI00140525AF|nr:S41 family peptidase [Actinomadura rubrisoli]
MKPYLISGRWSKAVLLACGSVLVMTAASASPSSAKTATAPPACSADPGPARAAETMTRLSTIEQAYNCVFANFYGRKKVDHRTLLASAFAGFTEELNRRGLDRADATMPPLSGDRAADWNAFGSVYQRVTDSLPDDPALKQAVAGATLNAMIGSLHDNHSHWSKGQQPPGGAEVFGLGIATFPAYNITSRAPQKALAPLYVSSVTGGPAADRRLRPGDVIESVNGAPPFVNGTLTTGVMDLLNPQEGKDAPVRLKLRRPASGRTWTATLKPRRFKPTTKTITSALLKGDVAGIKPASFGQPGTADQALAAIAELHKGRTLRGVVIDLRGSGGGSPVEAGRLLSAFTHGKTWSRDCDADDVCAAYPTDDSVPLLNLPVAVLTDGVCASACDAFSAAVKDLRVGPLIGARTAGMVSGPARAYQLDDGSHLLLPARYSLGPNREIINGIGIAPDHHIPRTAEDLSAGRDPAMAKALSILRG